MDKEKIKSILAKELYAESLQDNDLFSDMAVDELDELYVKLAIEIKLGIIIYEDDVFEKYPTVGEFVDMVVSL